ncbi:5-formyltetrahydrofolate cyclo-ligase [Ellagibacter isourolithinifaciens]|uniref:5-formyltetrahydrofolate cyclo-ligase n=1 Tax=Ellagibacter isourolithinifaciens TaxID=2137581 RepID=UPI002E77A3A0|nr:5-formyltetrahydrofolate cyclo-ligase [Ellagibacter isourolithinifaciens]MEE0245994.1 5-formyltetrahydrofolate cyclo-ligase [Ellagibacter isourolithinifaciens]
MNTKSETRRLVIARRNAIPSDERIARSEKACEELERYFGHTVASGSRIAVYHALGSEVDIAPFAKSARLHGWTCAFPVMVRNSNDAKARMTFWDVPLDGTQRAFFDKPARAVTPDDPSLADCTPCDPHEIDAVVVPMVAFDAGNMRLGYGGGNYDRFLRELRSDAVVCGIAFQEQEVEAVPTEPHDLALPKIIAA